MESMNKISIAYAFNCVDYDEDYFSDATVMAGALEESEEISPEEFDDTYATSVEELSHTFDIDISLIQVLEPFGLISLYDCDKDIHYFFEVL